MKIKVDRDLCESNGVCELAAPEVFRIDDDGMLQLLVEEPDATLRAKVERAIEQCPRGALSLVTSQQ